MSELEATVVYLQESLAKNKKAIFWGVSALLFFVFVMQVQEVSALLLASYGIALLLDPVVSSLQQKGISRAVSIVALGGAFLLFSALLFALAVPQIIIEYQELIKNLPSYSQSAIDRLGTLAEEWFGVVAPQNTDEIAAEVRNHISALGVEQLRTAGKALGATALKGYSFALTILNIFLLPFFVFYIARDLRRIHQTIGSFMDEEVKGRVVPVAKEILRHVYAFFKGQLTVSLILAGLYIVGFTIVGLPSSFVVGTLTGLLNIVPYLGVAIGFLLATIISLVSEPSLSHLLLVYAVFIAIQVFEGNFLTPKIVGESVGIHPLGVMVALIVGGDLFGLVGMILAIPVAASVRVLFQSILQALDEDDEETVMTESPVSLTES